MQVVLLHALPLDAAMWAGQLARLPEDTLAPDLYPLGDTMTQWAQAVLDLAASGPLLVVGCSVGGSCALEMAALAPDRLGAVVLVGAKAGHRRQPEVRDAAVALLHTEGLDAAWSQIWAPLLGPNTDGSIAATVRSIAMRQSVADIVRGVEVFHDRPDLDDFAATWRKPLYVISGKNDTSPSPTTAAALARAAPRGHFELVPDCGHYVNLERPQAFEALLAQFLRAEL